MLTGERRGVSGRRGMTVLGKIPAVPKPINLPSQRLENRGLDPNVEIVPRGSVSWGSAGRSPPTSTGAWGTAAPGSSPPVTNSAWGSKQGSSATGSNSTGGAAGAWGGGGSLPRPASAGSGTRPSSAGSIRQGEQQPDTPTANSSSNPPWGPRPTSGPGVQVQTQVQSQASFSRPRSADTLRAGPSLSGFGDSSAAALVPAPAWSGHATGGRLGQADEPHQASRFKLTRVDFPTLGSEKNPDLRPHPNSSVAEGLVSVDEKLVVAEERPPPTPPGPHDDHPHTPTGGYGSQERRMPDGWRRDGPPFGGHPTIPDGNWHRDGPPPPMPPYGGQGLPSDSWRREVPPSGSSLDDNWRRGGAPPIGQYGHNPRGPGGPSHFPHDGAGSMHQTRFGLGSGPYGPSHPGPSGFGRPGDMYPNGPLLRPGVPMRPNNMFPGPGPYDAYYGHPGYANMEEQQRMMSGMGGPGPAGHGGYPFHHGPPFENFYPHGGMSQGARQMPPHNFQDRNEGVGEGYNEGLSRGKGLKSVGVHTKDGRGDNEVFGEPILPSQETGESHPGGSRSITSTGGENFQQAPRPSSGGHHSSHRDWGAAVSSDEPMDFSKPVFEEEIQAGSPRKQQSPGIGNIEGNASANEVPLFDSGRTEAGSSEGKLSGEGPKDALENVMGGVGVAKETEIVAELEHKGGRSERDDVSEKPVQPLWKALNGKEKELTFSNNSAHMSVGKEVEHAGHDQSQQRAGNCPREVSASSASSGASSASTAAGEPVAAAAPRAGQHHSSATTKPSILGNSPRSAVAADEKSVREAVLEKQSSLTSPPAPGVDSNGQTNSVHILKGIEDGGQESPSRDKISVDMGASDISVASMTMGNEAKDGFKPKLRISSHDVDKEWRPKVGLGDTSHQLSSSAAMTQVTQPAPTAIPAVAELSDTAACESEIAPTSDYDFEAQRAKMREIAAQRARQLQKEEEERIREQKAKAHAKLEELNRRTTFTQVVTSEEADVEPQKVSDDSEGMLSEPVVVAPKAGHALEPSSSSGRQSGRNEQGKRKLKENPKPSPGDLRKRTHGSLSQPPPLLPSPNAQVAPLLPSPALEPQVQHPKSQQHSQQRSKGQQKQLVAKVDQADTPAPVLTIDIPTFGDNGGWVIHTPPSQDNDLAAASAVTSISEGPPGSRKKKSSRGSKNRQRIEGPASSVDITQVLEQSVNQTVDGSSGSDHPSDSAQAISWGSITQPQDSGKDMVHVEEANFSLSLSDVSTGDGIPGAANGDAFGQRLQRKPQEARRAVRVDRLSQDVRVTDKPHANDSMIWAPVRSPVTTEVGKLEALGEHSSEQKEEVSTQQRGRSKRAELERYTPKSVKQQQEALQQPSSPSQRAPILEIPLQPAPIVVATELQPVFVAKETKSFNESKQSESVTKPGRAHGLWRQRGSGYQDRRGENGKELLSAQHGSSPFQVEAAHDSQPSEEKTKGVQPPLAHTEPSSDHPVAVAEAVPSASAAVQQPEKEQQAPVMPYQPPRPGSAPGHRGHGPWNAESKGHQERAAHHTRSGGTMLDRVPSTGTAGFQHHPRGSGGNHPRQRAHDREEQVHASSNVQVEKSVDSSSKPVMLPTLHNHEQQEQQQMRPVKHISTDGGEAGSQRGRSRQDQTARPFSTAQQSQQRGQTHWQQTGNQEVHNSQQHLTEREEPVSSHHPQQDPPKQAGDFVKFQTGGEQQNKTHHQPLHPTTLVGSKAEGGQWDGEHSMSPQLGRGRDQGRVRRGRFGGGRSNARPAEMDQRREQPIPRQRLVIDATGGAVPSQVGG